MYENQLAALEGSQFGLENMKVQSEMMRDQINVIKTMQESNQMQKNLMKEMSADNMMDIAYDMREMQDNMNEINEILEDIDNFWKREDVFKKYGYTHKRGILLYGPPGNGKSYLIQLLSQYIINERKGIVVNLKDYSSVELFLEYASPVIRMIEKNTPMIVLMEDIDNILEYDRSTLTKVLNMLDGIKQIDKVVYIATTNYPEKLQERVSNRPSRFDRRYKINKPNAKVREFYIKNKVSKEDLKKIDSSKCALKTGQ